MDEWAWSSLLEVVFQGFFNDPDEVVYFKQKFVDRG